MLTTEELEAIRLRHKAEEVVYSAEGEVLGVVVYDSDAQAVTGDVDVAVEKIPSRDDDVLHLIQAVDEMQFLLRRIVEVAEGAGPNEHGVYPLLIDAGVLGRLKAMSGHG